MDENEITLSILVISHNQQNVLPRCIESILMQNMNFAFEIIINDDNSHDNTWEIVEGYARRYPGIVFGYQINSSDGNPVNRSERCGYNKANAYSHARGKYFVNIDADDYLLSNDIYQLQVKMLEENPECVMCMQNVSYYNEGNPPSYQELWFPQEKMTLGRILTPKEYILEKYSILNQAFVIRRLQNINPAKIMLKHFNDTRITHFYLQYGSIVCLNRADYAYVISKNSINSSLVGLDREVMMFGHIFYLIHFVPKFAGLLLRANLTTIKSMMQKTILLSQITPGTVMWLKQFTGFSFSMFLNSKRNLNKEIRKEIIVILIKLINRYKLHNKYTYKFLYILLMGRILLNRNINFSSN